MKPSLALSAPRSSLRRTLELVAALAVAGCCHPAAEQPPPPIKFTPVPTAVAKDGFVKVRDGLKGEDVPGEKSPIGQALVKTLSDRRQQTVYSELQDEFVKNLRCKDDGCYAELTAESPEKTVRINQFVTDQATPLSQWSGWRFVSGLYEGPATDQKQPSTDRSRRMAVVVLKGHAWGRQ
jgi:hypothetical protein